MIIICDVSLYYKMAVLSGFCLVLVWTCTLVTSKWHAGLRLTIFAIREEPSQKQVLTKAIIFNIWCFIRTNKEGGHTIWAAEMQIFQRKTMFLQLSSMKFYINLQLEIQKASENKVYKIWDHLQIVFLILNELKQIN